MGLDWSILSWIQSYVCSMYYLGILFYFTERCGVVIQYMYYPSVLHVQ